MDAFDRKILYELSKNGRISLKRLAQKIRLNQSTTLYRLDRLKKEDILIGTTTIINTYRLGYQGFRAYLRIHNTMPEIENKIKNWLIKRKETSVVGRMENHNEFVIMSWVSQTNKFYNFVQALKEQFRTYIKSFQIFPYTGTIYFPRKYLSNKKEKQEIILRMQNKEKFDEVDLKILQSIAYDARKPALEIAKEINKPARTIINRIKAMEKKEIIAGYGANINTKKIGYTYYKLNITFSKNINYHKLIEFVRKIPNTVYVDEAISNYDLEINLEVESKQKLNKIIDDLKLLTGGIKNIEIKQVEKYFKLGFLS